MTDHEKYKGFVFIQCFFTLSHSVLYSFGELSASFLSLEESEIFCLGKHEPITRRQNFRLV